VRHKTTRRNLVFVFIADNLNLFDLHYDWNGLLHDAQQTIAETPK
jgi:hypothetical protein